MPRKLMFLLLCLATACGGGADAAAIADSIASAPDSTALANAAARARANQLPTSAMALDTVALAGDQPLLRESFGYNVASRDPFKAVLSFETAGPELGDLKLTGVLYDVRSPSNSIATFRDIGSNKRYNVRPGDRIGRLLVASVQSQDVVLRMNDFGTIRDQTYSLRKTEDELP
jgi:hypothetical protein